MKEWTTLMYPERSSLQSWIDTLWVALEHVRESYTASQWHEIGEVMDWTAEELGCMDRRLSERHRGMRYER